MGLGPQIDKAANARPEGLLHFENYIIFSIFPWHVGMRWYWRDFRSMERWMEAIYTDLARPVGFQAFAPAVAARGSAFSAPRRLGQPGAVPPPPEGVSESEIY